jgi:hypothetical protein
VDSDLRRQTLEENGAHLHLSYGDTNMLVIRKVQLNALGGIPLSEFELQLVRHFARFYPRECRLAGNSQIQKLVGMGIQRALRHGYTSQREASLYVNLMIILGCDFDRDPQIPWAAQQLDDERVRGRFRRIQRVHQSAIRYLEKTVGDNNQHIARSMIRLRDYRLEDAPSSSGTRLAADLAVLLARFWGEKSSYQGAEAMRQLIAHAMSSAPAFGISGGRGLTVYTTLMFMLGSGFASDPLYPWAGRVLSDDRLPDESARVTELHREAISYLNQSLSAN